MNSIPTTQIRRALAIVAITLLTPTPLLAEDTTDTIELENPLSFDSFTEFLSAILGIVMILAVPIVVFFIVYAGFLYVTAQGNSEQVGKATRALTYAIVGGLIILGAEVLAGIIENVVNDFSRE